MSVSRSRLAVCCLPWITRSLSASLLISFATTLLTCAGCGFIGEKMEDISNPPMKIGDVLLKHSELLGKEVSLRGRVSGAVAKWYWVRDDTGEIRISTDDALPGVGAELRVTGVLNCSARINNTCIGVHLEERSRRQRS